MSSSRPAAAMSPDGLVRALGLVESSAMVVGTLIGTGIFFVFRDMVRAAG